MDFDDDWDKHKLGRYDDREAREVETMFRRRKRPGRSGGLLSRMELKGLNARVAAATGRYDRQALEVAVLAKGCPKTISAIKKTIRYIGRHQAKDEKMGTEGGVSPYDRFHAVVPPDQVAAELARWNLSPDEGNLSKRARDLIGSEGKGPDKKLPAVKRYWWRSRHLAKSALRSEPRVRRGGSSWRHRAIGSPALLVVFITLKGFREVVRSTSVDGELSFALTQLGGARSVVNVTMPCTDSHLKFPFPM